MEKLGIQLIILGIFTRTTFPGIVAGAKEDYTDSTGYILVKKTKGIELYEKWIDLSSELKAREVKVVYTIHATMESAAALLDNEAKAIQWNKGSRLYKIIPIDDNSWISYIQYDLPWPFDNQDCVLQYTAYYLAYNNIVVDFRSVDHEIFPSLKNVSRLDKVKGRWTFKETPNGTRVEYLITTTPSTTLPRWVTDPIVRNNLIDTMNEFRNILEVIKN